MMDRDNGGQDLAFFISLAQHGSLAATALALNVTPSAVSRRLAALEARLGVVLLHRTTRRQSLTPEGERYLEEGRRILADLHELESDLAASRQQPRGVLRVNAGFGFGRRHLGPAISDFQRNYPEMEVILHLSDRPMDLLAEGMDVAIRFGLGEDKELIARKIASNHRRLCAAPQYLSQHPPPSEPMDLRHHHCIVIRENPPGFHHWHLVRSSQKITVKVHGGLSVNHGEIAVDWALAGHGILLRSEWDVASYIRSGDLCPVLPDWRGLAADLYVVYPPRHGKSAKVRAFVEFLAARFAEYRQQNAIW